MKIVKWVLLSVVILIVVTVAAVWMNLNGIIRRTVETQSTNQLKVNTTLEGVNLSLFGGDVSLNNFEIGSPQGFKAPQMMSLGGLDVQTSIGNLRSDPVKVQSIMITDPKLVLEMVGRDFNIKKFMDGLPKGDQPTDPQPDGSEPIKLVIDLLTVKGTEVVLRPDPAALQGIPGAEGLAKNLKEQYVLRIPDIVLNNIGTGEGAQNGAAIKDVVTQIMNKMASEAAKSEDLPPELRALLTGDLTAIKDQVVEKVSQEAKKQIDKATTEAQETLQKEAGEAGKAVGDLLKNPNAQDAKKTTQDLVGGFLGGQKKKAPTTQP